MDRRNRMASPRCSAPRGPDGTATRDDVTTQKRVPDSALAAHTRAPRRPGTSAVTAVVL